MYQIWRRKVFRSHNLSKDTKMRGFRTLVMSVLLYGAETWPVTKKEIRKPTTFQNARQPFAEADVAVQT